ncbi:hypothetical protein I553_0179 [Mycobacterium xenopi 4042]|uniref:Uncharacterized protein n=1 Tax=Mycobacterium xenopi 4042 TaxID=1299334 RepID=X7YJL4_MYCXE|nr:hypothetical protein I553_0179 [Mycobacterium xenopi 4042]
MRHAETLPDWPSGPLPAVRVAAAIPSPEQHRTPCSRHETGSPHRAAR